MTFFLRNAGAIAGLCVCIGSDAGAQADRPAIRGRVLAADSDAPLRRARVSITAPNPRFEIVLTDNDGRFAIEVPGAVPGAFTVTIAKGGYVTTTVRVERKAIETPLLVRPLRAAAISGVVVDRDGAPVSAMSVTARRIPLST